MSFWPDNLRVKSHALVWTMAWSGSTAFSLGCLTAGIFDYSTLPLYSSRIFDSHVVYHAARVQPLLVVAGQWPWPGTKPLLPEPAVRVSQLHADSRADNLEAWLQPDAEAMSVSVSE